MMVREQTLITVTVEEVRMKLPFPMLGLDVDNDSAFINQTVLDYCNERKIALTRSRPYKKNDQAWIDADRPCPRSEAATRACGPAVWHPLRAGPPRPILPATPAVS